MADPDPRDEPQHQHDHNGPDSLFSGIANLRGTGLPWREVVAMAASNVKRKITSMRGCCGNYGQPGC